MTRVDWLVTEMNVLGGVETFIRITAPRIRKLGWDIHVITMISGGVLVDQLRAEGVPVIELGLNSRNPLSVIQKLLKLWNKDKPRLLHTHLYHAGLIGRLTGRLVGIKSIVVQQAGPELRRGKLRAGLDQYTSFLVNQYVATCTAVKEILQTREHIPADKITVIPNGIIIQQQYTPNKPANWPVTGNGTVLGVVGRLSPEKGHHLFLDALSILSQKGKNFQAVVIGDGPLRNELLQRTKDLHLEHHISWVGSQTNIPDWLPFFDLFILPSQWEGISMALLEAMEAGLPIVATNIGGNPDVVDHNVTGLLVPPLNPQLLAEAISKLIDDESLRQAMGKAGRTRCEQTFDIDTIVHRIGSLYQNYLGVSPKVILK